MASINQKNMMLSPAAVDLGLGDQLRSEVEAKTLDLKKKKQGQQSGILVTAPSMLGLEGANYG